MNHDGSRGADFRSHTVTAADGLRLHVREYGAPDPNAPGRPPVICLPGLTRTAADYHDLARALAGDPARPRRVLAVDYRGRGSSDYDPDPSKYAIPVEMADLLAVMTALAAMPAVLIGTSRGGLITMTLAAVRPDVIAGAVLNDIGPVVDTTGLVRIKGYVGQGGAPATIEEAASALASVHGAQFPDYTRDDWIGMASRAWRRENGRLVSTYDPALSRAVAAFSAETPIPPMWQAFDALIGVPVMVIRGELSDILSAGTVAEMKARRPDLETIEVPRQGHAPLLAEPWIAAKIANFVDFCAERRGL
jgi:pimeloyl-ACP methyl ester carboxylesterase